MSSCVKFEHWLNPVVSLIRPDRLAGVALAAAWLLLSSHVAAQETPSPEVSATFQVLDGDGHALHEATGVIRLQPSGSLVDLIASGADGQAVARLAPGSYDSTWYVGGTQMLELPFAVEGEDFVRQIQVPLYTFRIELSAANGDPMNGARIEVRSADGHTGTFDLVGGVAEGLAPEGNAEVNLIWDQVRSRVTDIKLPDSRRRVLELPVQVIDVRVVQQGTNAGFGPARVSLASTGLPFSAGVWTDYEGRASLGRVQSDVQVRADWFGVQAESEGTIPGEAIVVMPLATRVIPGPAEGGPDEPYLVSLNQPEFQAWATGIPGSGVRLPLPDGKYQATIFDAQRKPLFRGLATLSDGQASAEVEWQKAQGDDGMILAERSLSWARDVWGTVPSVGLQEIDGWRSLNVKSGGEIGLLPPGMLVRIPDHVLGGRYTTDREQIPVRIGVLELRLPKAARVKIYDAAKPDNSIVEECKTTVCQVPLPPGRYMVYTPDTQLELQPVLVNEGKKSSLRFTAL